MNGRTAYAFFLTGLYVMLVALNILHPPPASVMPIAQGAEAALGPLVGAVVHALFKSENPTPPPAK